MLLEAQRVVACVLDGLRAASFIGWHHSVAKRWSADLTTALTCTAEELMRMIAALAAEWLPIFTGRLRRAPYFP